MEKNGTKTRAEVICPLSGAKPPEPPQGVKRLTDTETKCWVCGSHLIVGLVKERDDRSA